MRVELNVDTDPDDDIEARDCVLVLRPKTEDDRSLILALARTVLGGGLVSVKPNGGGLISSTFTPTRETTKTVRSGHEPTGA